MTHGIDPKLVIFEITETALVRNEGVAQVFIESVRRLGCGVALDDFGTGYGSFRYLKHLPVSLLKIDQEFVRDLEGETSMVNRHVIEATVTLARGMGQKTVAEGIETESTLAIVRELGVDYAQGYLFGRPAPAEQVLPSIRQEL
jgi:EAL domain-containing protein (putative c-di-GMP-specific phosphodiesterase class I)